MYINKNFKFIIQLFKDMFWRDSCHHQCNLLKNTCIVVVLYVFHVSIFIYLFYLSTYVICLFVCLFVGLSAIKLLRC